MATMGLIWGVHGAVVCTLWSDLMLAPELMGHLWGGPRASPDLTQSVDTDGYLIWGVGWGPLDLVGASKKLPIICGNFPKIFPFLDVAD